MLRALTLLALSAPTLAQGTVHVVDELGGPGSDFTNIQPAVDAAAAGDVVLVRTGAYSPFDIVGKSLSVLADEDATVHVIGANLDGETLISGIGVGQRVTLHGIDFFPFSSVTAPLIHCTSSEGAIWIDDVSVSNFTGVIFGQTNTTNQTVLVDGCANVVLSNFSSAGLSGVPQGQGLEAGALGLRSLHSTLYLFNADITSGQTLVSSSIGRVGTDIDGGFAALRASTITGGPGGEAIIFGPGPGPGGPGLRARNGAEVWSIGTELVGGPGGFPALGGAPGPDGPPFELQTGGTVTEEEAINVHFEATAVARDDDSASLTITTAPDSVVLLLAAFDPLPVFLDTVPGTLATGFGFAVVALPTTDAAGQTTLDVALPLPKGFDSFDALLQIVAVTPDPDGSVELSNPAWVTWVQESF